MARIEDILRQRPDHSQYLVHLTRDLSLDGQPLSAREVLIRILKEMTLKAKHSHGAVRHRLAANDALLRRIASVCLSEMPIGAIRFLSQTIEGRAIRLAPYGLVFHKDFARKAGGNPVWYLNTYGGSGLMESLRKAIPSNDGELLESPLLSLLPFIDICGPKKGGGRYDFSWEREWRVVGNLQFAYDDVVVGICDAPDEVEALEAVTGNEVPFIWKEASVDEIVACVRKLASHRMDIDGNAQRVVDDYHADWAADAEYDSPKDDMRGI